MRSTARLTLILAAMPLFVLPAGTAESPGTSSVLKNAKTRMTAPAFDLKNSAGKRIRLAGFRGRVLLLNFWATWCGGCRMEMPWFEEFRANLGRQGLSVLGVSLDEEGWAAITPYIERHPIGFPIVLAGDSTVRDYAVTGLPSTVLIDRKGRIAAVYTGLVDKRDLEANLGALLAER